MNEFFSLIGQFKEKSKGRIPSIRKTQHFIDELILFLFPVKEEGEESRSLADKYQIIHNELEALIRSIGFVQEDSMRISRDFMLSLAELYPMILEDAKALYDGDPAAESIEEVILTYPGFIATAIYRISHKLYEFEVPLIPRILSEYAHHKSGIDIHPGAIIGSGFCIDHGTGIVIGETAVIGNFVKIYQGVTIGALSVKKRDRRKKRHPSIGDYVTIYAGATILGGETLVGHHSIVGGNAWLVKSIEPFSKVTNRPQITVTANKVVQ